MLKLCNRFFIFFIEACFSVYKITDYIVLGPFILWYSISLPTDLVIKVI